MDMTPKRKTDYIKIIQPDGQNMIAAPDYIRKLLGLDPTNVFNRLERLERKVDRLEAPGRQAKILQLLQEHGEHNRIWINNRVGNIQWYDIGQLVDAGLVVHSKAGSVTMYSCKVGSE